MTWAKVDKAQVVGAWALDPARFRGGVVDALSPVAPVVLTPGLAGRSGDDESVGVGAALAQAPLAEVLFERRQQLDRARWPLVRLA